MSRADMMAVDIELELLRCERLPCESYRHGCLRRIKLLGELREIMRSREYKKLTMELDDSKKASKT
jgi:hypothetical protein